MQRPERAGIGRALLALICSMAASGCECSEAVAPDGGGIDAANDRRDALVPDEDGGLIDASGMDANVSTDAAPGPDGSVDSGLVILPDGSVLLPDGAVPECIPALCQGHLYQCGNCIDDDEDGPVDSRDVDCLGPCDNSEDGLSLDIPGIGATCNRDCYFDQDSGNGNDGCAYSLECDPLSPGVRPSGSSCPYDASATCPTEQPARCIELCGPLAPNGCDCFGCCDIPGGSGNYVFVGSEPAAGAPPCSMDSGSDPASCRPCTPTTACFNPCGHCELCLGRTELPADCFPPPPLPDGGVPPRIDAGPRPDGSPAIDAGPPPPIDAGPPPPPRCPPGQQACGLPGDPACPAGFYCLTGCCIYFG